MRLALLYIPWTTGRGVRGLLEKKSIPWTTGNNIKADARDIYKVFTRERMVFSFFR